MMFAEHSLGVHHLVVLATSLTFRVRYNSSSRITQSDVGKMFLKNYFSLFALMFVHLWQHPSSLFAGTFNAVPRKRFLSHRSCRVYFHKKEILKKLSKLKKQNLKCKVSLHRCYSNTRSNDYSSSCNNIIRMMGRKCRHCTCVWKLRHVRTSPVKVIRLH